MQFTCIKLISVIKRGTIFQHPSQSIAILFPFKSHFDIYQAIIYKMNSLIALKAAGKKWVYYRIITKRSAYRIANSLRDLFLKAFYSLQSCSVFSLGRFETVSLQEWFSTPFISSCRAYLEGIYFITFRCTALEVRGNPFHILASFPWRRACTRFYVTKTYFSVVYYNRTSIIVMRNW